MSLWSNYLNLVIITLAENEISWIFKITWFKSDSVTITYHYLPYWSQVSQLFYMYLLAKFDGHNSNRNGDVDPCLNWISNILNSPPRFTILRDYENQEYRPIYNFLVPEKFRQAKKTKYNCKTLSFTSKRKNVCLTALTTFNNFKWNMCIFIRYWKSSLLWT